MGLTEKLFGTKVDYETAANLISALGQDPQELLKHKHPCYRRDFYGRVKMTPRPEGTAVQLNIKMCYRFVPYWDTIMIHGKIQLEKTVRDRMTVLGTMPYSAAQDA